MRTSSFFCYFFFTDHEFLPTSFCHLGPQRLGIMKDILTSIMNLMLQECTVNTRSTGSLLSLLSSPLKR